MFPAQGWYAWVRRARRRTAARWVEGFFHQQASDQLREDAAAGLAVLEEYRHPLSAQLFYESSPGHVVHVLRADDRAAVLSLKEVAKASNFGLSWKSAINDHMIVNYVSALRFEPVCRNGKYVGVSGASARHVAYISSGGQRRDGTHICLDSDCAGGGGCRALACGRWRVRGGAFWRIRE